MKRTRLATQVIAPYTGRRIAGMSDDVVEARFTIEYAFDAVVIVVENIPGRWDRGNNRELVSGKVASQVQMLVDEARAENAQVSQEQPDNLLTRASTYVLVHIDASNLSSAA